MGIETETNIFIYRLLYLLYREIRYLIDDNRCWITDNRVKQAFIHNYVMWTVPLIDEIQLMKYYNDIVIIRLYLWRKYILFRILIVVSFLDIVWDDMRLG